MFKKKFKKIAFLSVPLTFCSQIIYGQINSNYSLIEISNWETPVGSLFDGEGRMYVFEKNGKIYQYHDSEKYLVIDISEEVENYSDCGLLGMTLDPDFLNNGNIYLYYVVDRHYLLNYGETTYNSELNEVGATIGRITKYSLDKAFSFKKIIPNSRKILLGTSKSNGIPITGIWHAGGDLEFGNDGTLLISVGEGSGGNSFESQAYSDQILTEEEFIAASGSNKRAQLMNCLNGKILRIDPETGFGINSNPYFESSSPNSNNSKIWAIGFRNPYRMTRRPNTGSENSANGNPGVFLVGEVGNNGFEEINVIDNNVRNFGWPWLEGITTFLNNPNFELNTPNVKPSIVWGRHLFQAKVKVNGNMIDMGTSSFTSPKFVGGCSIGGIFYPGNKYHPSLTNSYFFADYNNKWLKFAKFDINNNPTEINDLGLIQGLVDIAFNPADDLLYFTSINGKIYKLVYSSNLVPEPLFDILPNYGNLPLTVSFDASKSYILNENLLAYEWNFGDGTTGAGRKINHTFSSSILVNELPVKLKVINTSTGAFSEITKKVYFNNSPPTIISTSLDSIDFLPKNQNKNLILKANVFDKESPNSNLSYKWEIFFYHSEHKHPEFASIDSVANYNTDLIPCDSILYYYLIKLTVSDSQGLYSIFEKKLFTQCVPTDTIPNKNNYLKIENLNNYGFSILWGTDISNTDLKNTELVINDETIQFLGPNISNFDYNSLSKITGQKYNIYLVFRDFNGNSTKTSVLEVTIPENICASTNEDLTTLPLSSTITGIVRKNISNDGNPLRLENIVYPTGYGMHVNASIEFNINSNFNRFKAKVGLDSEVATCGCGEVYFKVYGDNVLLYSSPILTPLSPSNNIDINITNVTILKLVAISSPNGDCCGHADWVNVNLIKDCAVSIIDKLAPNPILEVTTEDNGENTKIFWNLVTDNVDNSLIYEVFINDILVGSTTNSNYTVPILTGNNIIHVQVSDQNKNTTASIPYFLLRCPENAELGNFSISNSINGYTVKNAVKLFRLNGIISNNLEINSGKSLLLEPGFKVENGVLFVGKIQSCF